MSIKLLIKDFLMDSEISQCVSTAQLANNLHPLDGSALVVCQRFITHLARQGVPMGQGYALSMCMRIIQSRPKGDRTVLTVLAPVYRSSNKQLWTAVVIKVSVPNQSTSSHFSDLEVGMCLRIDPLWIWDFDLPCTEFRVDRFEVVENPLINPFDYVDRRGLGPGVYYRQALGYSSNRSGDELIPLGDLISLLASVCRFMDPHDLMLLDHMVAKNNRMQQFMLSPASTQSHHNYRHGLLVHTVQTCIQILVLLAKNHSKTGGSQAADFASKNQAKSTESRIEWGSRVAQGIACGVLHDFGKIDEYEDLGNGAYALSDSGLFLGHQLKVCLWLYHAAVSSGYSEQDRLLELIHCLSAVDREYDQCGLRTRKTFISKIVNQADRLSAGQGSAFAFDLYHSALTGQWDVFEGAGQDQFISTNQADQFSQLTGVAHV